MAGEKKIVGAVSVPQEQRTFVAGEEEEFEAAAKKHELDLNALEQSGAVKGFGKATKETEEEGGTTRRLPGEAGDEEAVKAATAEAKKDAKKDGK